jgi:Zn-finger nucleic acid-binding protein
MHCPACKSAMIILEYNQIEIDFCPSCNGIWLDQGEFELMLGLPAQAFDLSLLKKAQKSRRRCPRCRKKMKRDLFPQTKVEVDFCPGDGGLWLDKGELQQIAQVEGNKSLSENLKKYFNDLLNTNS